MAEGYAASPVFGVCLVIGGPGHEYPHRYRFSLYG